MSNISKTVALFSVLSLIATGCQKESLMGLQPENPMSDVDTVYTVQYIADGVLHQTTLHSKAERADFLRQLFAMAENGSEVIVCNNNEMEHFVATKEVVTHSTTSKEEAIAWTERMHENGYDVGISYDSENHVYICVAWKR